MDYEEVKHSKGKKKTFNGGKAYILMYKIAQIIHLSSLEKYILVTRENASLCYRRRAIIANLENPEGSVKPNSQLVRNPMSICRNSLLCARPCGQELGTATALGPKGGAS